MMLRALFVFVCTTVIAKVHAELQGLCTHSLINTDIRLYFHLGVPFKLFTAYLQMISIFKPGMFRHDFLSIYLANLYNRLIYKEICVFV